MASANLIERAINLAHLIWKILDNNDLNQVVASSGFSENKGLGGVLSLAGSLDFRCNGLIYSYYISKP